MPFEAIVPCQDLLTFASEKMCLARDPARNKGHHGGNVQAHRPTSLSLDAATEVLEASG